jgi:DNA-binding transcriptional MerR regulator
VRLYTVSEVAKLSGVSVRTLHHYHEVGLLKPAAVGANGYRHYGEDELLRLQQILFHREVGLPLGEIRRVLDAPDFDRAAALRAHRSRLAEQARRYRRLIRTIDETLAALEGATTMDDKRMYRGFKIDEAEVTKSEDWLRSRFGPQIQANIDRSHAVGASWSDEERETYDREGREFDEAVAKAMQQGLAGSSGVVQDLVRAHCATVCRGWGVPPSKGACLTLAEIYRDGPMFEPRFKEIGPGAAAYVGDAIRTYAERELA